MRIYSNRVQNALENLLGIIKEEKRECESFQYKKILVYLEAGQISEVEKLMYQMVMSRNWQDRYILILSYIDIYNGKLFKAERSINILNDSSHNPRYLEVLGDLNFAMGKYKKAGYYYKQILIKDKFNIEALSKLADSYINLGQWDKARKVYGKIPRHKLSKRDKTNIRICYKVRTSDVTKINIVYSNGKRGLVENVQISSLDLGQGIYCTGNINEEIKESAFVALSYLMNSKYTDKDFTFRDKSFHFHFPYFQTYKSGPSGGLSLVVGLYNHIKNINYNSKIAFTGEIDIEGNIYPIGSINEKIQGCIEKGIEVFFIPRNSIYDSKILCRSKNLKIVPVKRIEEVIEYYERVN